MPNVSFIHTQNGGSGAFDGGAGIEASLRSDSCQGPLISSCASPVRPAMHNA